MKQTAERLIQILNEHGKTAYLVGGCVRDLVMGRAANDYDICTSATPDEMLSIFSDYATLTNGVRHGTVGVIVDSTVYEITTYRAEGAYSDGRHPDCVTFCAEVEADLARRDFTMNAMAMHGEQLLDLFGGKKDIQAKTVRCVGNADERLTEDSLRILRALRFASRFLFSIEQSTARAIHTHYPLLKNISSERIYSELCLFLQGEGACVLIEEFADVLGFIIGDFDARVAAKLIKRLPCDVPMRLAALLQSRTAEQTLRRLKAQKSVINEVQFLLDNAENFKNCQTIADFCGFLVRFGQKRCEKLLVFTRIEEGKVALYRRAVEAVGDLSLKTLAINGNDLAAVGFSGKEIGVLLNCALQAVAKGALKNDRAEILAYLLTEGVDKSGGSVL